MKSCFLFGHRDAPCEIRTSIEEAVERHYRQYGVNWFYVGRYGAFDSMAASAVKAAKNAIAILNCICFFPTTRHNDLLRYRKALTAPFIRLWKVFLAAMPL